jgi:hypothetical protein
MSRLVYISLFILSIPQSETSVQYQTKNYYTIKAKEITVIYAPNLTCMIYKRKQFSYMSGTPELL